MEKQKVKDFTGKCPFEISITDQPIEELIKALEFARDIEGATHVEMGFVHDGEFRPHEAFSVFDESMIKPFSERDETAEEEEKRTREERETLSRIERAERASFERLKSKYEPA